MIPNGGFDMPSALELDASMLFGSVSLAPSSIRIGKGVTVQDQGAEKITEMACGSYSSVHGENSMRRKDGFTVEVGCKNHRKEFVEEYQPYYTTLGLTIIKDGSYLQHQVAFLKKKDYVSGYYKVVTREEMVQALAVGRAIVTGSMNIDRKKTRETGRATRGKGSAHLFAIVGYDLEQEYFVCMNSYGPKAYNKGYFYLSFSDLDVLYTRYALVDKKEVAQMNRILVDYRLSISMVGHRIKQGLNIRDEMTKENKKYQKYFDYLIKTGAIEEIRKKVMAV